MNPLVLIALGNPLMSDEGIGIRVASEIAKHVPPGVDVLDLGTGGMDVLHAIAGRRKVVFVDCAKMGEPPGTIRRFTPDEVRSVKALSGFSAHEGDLLTILDLSLKLGESPNEIVLFGIEPESLALGPVLSPALETRVPEYVAAVLRELAEKNES